MADQTGAGAEADAYYPAFFNLRGRVALVVGGGTIAAGKVAGLLPCGLARILVVAPQADPSIRSAAALGQVEWLARGYQTSDVCGANVVFAATDDRALNARVARDARASGALVLAVDDPPNCDFIAPAIVRRGAVTVAISTNGRSPALARLTRERLERLIPAYWGDLLTVAARVRQQLRAQGQQVDPERWNAALDAEVERLVERGDHDAARARLEAALQASAAADLALEPAHV